MFLRPEGTGGFSPGLKPWEPTIAERRALKGRQIERTNKVEVGPIVARLRCACYFW
jgi:hypothetical protein